MDEQDEEYEVRRPAREAVVNELADKVWHLQHPEVTGAMFVPLEIIDKANVILDSMKDMVVWPEDDWKSLGPDWDLNLFADDQGKGHASIYSVKARKTLTDRWYTLK